METMFSYIFLRMLKSFLHFILIPVLDFSPSHWIDGTVTSVYQPWRMDDPRFFAPLAWAWSQPLLSAPARGQPHLPHGEASPWGAVTVEAQLACLSAGSTKAPLAHFSFPPPLGNKQEDEIYSSSPSLHVLIPCSAPTYQQCAHFLRCY